MKPLPPAPSRQRHTAWQLLVQANLVPDEGNVTLLAEELAARTLPLGLPAALLQEVMASIWESTFPGSQPAGRFEFSFYFPAQAKACNLASNAWGWFRIEKSAALTSLNGASRCSIAFYFYLEG